MIWTKCQWSVLLWAWTDLTQDQHKIQIWYVIQEYKHSIVSWFDDRLLIIGLTWAVF